MTEIEPRAHNFSRGSRRQPGAAPEVVVVPRCENVVVGYRSSNKTAYSAKYHLIWCPKYRRRVLVGAVEERLKEILGRVALGRLPCSWGPWWFCSTVGGAPLEVVRGNVENQKQPG